MTPSTPTTWRVSSRNGATIKDEPESEKSLFSEPMKMRTPSARFRSAEQFDDVLFGFEGIEKLADALEIFCRRDVLQEIALAAHDQALAIVGDAGPFGEAGLDDLLRQLVEFGLGGVERLFEFGLGLRQGHAANMGIQIVRRFLQRRRRQAFRQCDDAVFDVLVLVDENDEAAPGFERHEFDMAKTRDLFFGKHDASAVRQAGDQLACLASSWSTDLSRR